ncbi:MAG: hypothetical protein K9G46_09135 [Flavobacteriales bacterium]|nr:hypothetical protein [Flavobacteriales bacterium]
MDMLLATDARMNTDFAQIKRRFIRDIRENLCICGKKYVFQYESAVRLD